MLSTPDISDKFPDYDVITDFNHYGGIRKFCGPVTTVDCFEDNSLIKTALSKVNVGGVLVVSGKKSQKVALLGDNIALMAKNNGWTGIVIDGYVRDIELLKKINIGVMALGSNPRKSKKENKGEINIDIRINNVIIKQGNWLYADLNGIIISSKKLKL